MLVLVLPSGPGLLAPSGHAGTGRPSLGVPQLECQQRSLRLLRSIRWLTAGCASPQADYAKVSNCGYSLPSVTAQGDL